MTAPSAMPGKARGFTLIELLVVITIIGILLDPWGKPYQVSTDTNLDNRNGALSIPRPVLVWSGGQDEDLSTLNDNIKNW